MEPVDHIVNALEAIAKDAITASDRRGGVATAITDMINPERLPAITAAILTTLATERDAHAATIRLLSARVDQATADLRAGREAAERKADQILRLHAAVDQARQTARDARRAAFTPRPHPTRELTAEQEHDAKAGNARVDWPVWTSPCDPLVELVDGQATVTCRRDGSVIAAVVGELVWSELVELVIRHRCPDRPTTAPTVDAEDLTSREEDDPTGPCRLRARWKDLITQPDRAASEKDEVAGSAVLAAGVATVYDDVCDTCSGEGEVHEEGRPGGHHGGMVVMVPCPDCSCPECGRDAALEHETGCPRRGEPTALDEVPTPIVADELAKRATEPKPAPTTLVLVRTGPTGGQLQEATGRGELVGYVSTLEDLGDDALYDQAIREAHHAGHHNVVLLSHQSWNLTGDRHINTSTATLVRTGPDGGELRDGDHVLTTVKADDDGDLLVPAIRAVVERGGTVHGHQRLGDTSWRIYVSCR